ncbi:MAG: acetolactate synthase small subunit [Phycisphaerae bacterium]|nr:acetolactate synthase small subunit [Phycisphaerae bacterium]
MQKHIFSVLVQNQPGVLAHIAGMFAARGFNIDSLVVGRTEDPQFSHMVIVSSGDELTMEQIRKQLGKIITIVKVRDVTEQDCVQRDLLLVRVHCPSEKRSEIRDLAEIFRASIVDVGPKSVLLQLTGTEDKIEAFVELCRPHGIKQLSRTGVIAIPRDNQRNEAASGPPQVRRCRTRSTVSTSPEVAALPPS